MLPGESIYKSINERLRPGQRRRLFIHLGCVHFPGHITAQSTGCDEIFDFTPSPLLRRYQRQGPTLLAGIEEVGFSDNGLEAKMSAQYERRNAVIAQEVGGGFSP